METKPKLPALNLILLLFWCMAFTITVNPFGKGAALFFVMLSASLLITNKITETIEKNIPSNIKTN